MKLEFFGFYGIQDPVVAASLSCGEGWAKGEDTPMHHWQKPCLTVTAVWLACAWIVPVTSEAAELDIQLVRIEVREQARRVEHSAWRPYLKSDDTRVRVAAIRAIGRVQKPKLTTLVQNVMGDPSLEVRLAAAHAAGLMGSGTRNKIVDRLAVETAPAVRQALVWSLRHVAQADQITTLLDLMTDDDVIVRAQSLYGLSRLVKRTPALGDKLDPTALLSALQDSDPTVRFAAIDLISRVQTFKSPQLLEALGRCLDDGQPTVRMLCVRTLGRFGPTGKALRDKAALDSDWRVGVETARADVRAGDVSGLAERIEAFSVRLETEKVDLRTAALHPIQGVFEGALSLPSNDAIVDAATKVVLAMALSGQSLGADSSGQLLGESHVHCAAAALVDRANQKRKFTRMCGAKDYPRGLREKWMLHAADEIKGPTRSKVVVKLYNEFSFQGRIEILKELGSEDDKTLTQLLEAAFQSGGAALVGTAALAAVRTNQKQLAADMVSAYQRLNAAREFEAVQSIFSALGRLHATETRDILKRHLNDSHPGVRRAAQEAVDKFDKIMAAKARAKNPTAVSMPPRRRLFAPPPAEVFEEEGLDKRLIEPSKYERATLKTTKGNVVLRLRRKQVLDTVKNFARLAKKGFYNGLTFHRMVANFVVQGGDPRGDGWGGPGYTIPCEIDSAHFETGSVGMALAGRDTGGSQFFITHSPQPRLDGRYTNFARVIEGQDVVDALTIGDRILSVELHTAP